MSMRRVVLTVATALLLLVPLGGAGPAVAKKAPSANKQVNRAFSLLVRDTRLVPKRAVSKRNRAALLKTAKTAEEAGSQAAVCIDQDAAQVQPPAEARAGAQEAHPRPQAHRRLAAWRASRLAW